MRAKRSSSASITGDAISVGSTPADYGSMSSMCSVVTDSTLILTAGAPEEPNTAIPPPYTPRQRSLLVGMTVVSFLNGSLKAVMIPFFPVEAVSQTVISGEFSCFALTQVLLYPLVGPLALRVGVTRLYNAGIVTAGLSTVLFGMFSLYIPGGTGFIAACFLARMLVAAGSAVVSACSFTIIGSQLKERTSSAVALVTTAQSAGLVIGAGLFALAGYGLPFYVVGGAMVAVAPIRQYCFTPVVLKADDEPDDQLRTIRILISSFEIWLGMLIVFSYTLAFVSFASCAAPYAKDVLGITPATLGLYLTVAAGSHVATSFLWAWLAERAVNPYPMMALSLLLSAVSQLLIPLSPLLGLQPSWWLFGLGVVLQEALYGVAYIPCFQLMLAASTRAGLPDELTTHAFLSGVYWTMYSLGIVMGPLAGRLLVDAYGYPLMMTVVAGETLLVMLMTAGQAAVKARELRRST